MDVHLVDGTYELFRYHFAPNNKDPNKGAVRGVLGSLLMLLESGATHVGVATDHVIESFRNDLWPGYKTSAGMPPELLAQFGLLEDMLVAAGITTWPMVELEADDALGAAARVAAEDDRVERVFICTPDKDLGQCVGGKVVQWDRRRDLYFDAVGVREKFGVDPGSIPDYLALVGDSADGFPGLPGFGARSAAAVLAKYEHLEKVPAAGEEWGTGVRNPGRLAATLRDNFELALLFRRIATLESDADVLAGVDDLCWTGPEFELVARSEAIGALGLAERAIRLAERRGAQEEGLMAPKSVTEIEVDGHTLPITNPDKTYFPTRGESKMDLVAYYLAVAEPLMAAIRGRPLLLQRFPEGATGKSWFQKRVPESRPDWLQSTVVSTPNGTTSDALVAHDLAHVLWAVNLGCIGFHVWPYLAADPVHADELRIDLDPSPGIEFEQVREAAGELKQLFDEDGIASYPKTTGNRGLHVYVRLEPRWDSYEVRAAAVAVGRELERRRPELITAQWWKEERGSRVFVDFNQNAPHKTVFGAWSVRPRAGGQVSTPFSWDELPTVHPDELTLVEVPGRVERDGDPWAASLDDPQSLEPLLERSARDLASGLMDAPWPPVYPKMPGEPPRVAPSRKKADP